MEARHVTKCIAGEQRRFDLHEGYIHAAERWRRLVSIADDIRALTARAETFYPTHIVHIQAYTVSRARPLRKQRYLGPGEAPRTVS